jgi:hypothetical protein
MQAFIDVVLNVGKNGMDVISDSFANGRVDYDAPAYKSRIASGTHHLNVPNPHKLKVSIGEHENGDVELDFSGFADERVTYNTLNAEYCFTMGDRHYIVTIAE